MLTCGILVILKYRYKSVNALAPFETFLFLFKMPQGQETRMLRSVLAAGKLEREPSSPIFHSPIFRVVFDSRSCLVLSLSETTRKRLLHRLLEISRVLKSPL